MKKSLQLSLIAVALFAACKKSDPTTPSTTPTTTTTTIPSDGWMLNGTKYKQAYCLRQASVVALNAVDATTGTVNSFAAFFKSYPTADGKYRIVKYTPDSTSIVPGNKIGANDIIIMGSVPKTGGGSGDKSYWTMGFEGKDATVTVSGGKIKVEVPEVAVTSGNNDTLKITGTMIEN